MLAVVRRVWVVARCSGRRSMRRITVGSGLNTCFFDVQHPFGAYDGISFIYRKSLASNR